MNGANEVDDGPKYYHLTPSAGLEVIQDTLRKAFHEGAVVIIDELNTVPLEDLLNPMLSGVDNEGQPAQHPGFTLIATQNPITFAKRQSLSPALLNRCQKINLKDYPTHELIEIMAALNPSPEWVNTNVLQFVQALGFAKQYSLHPKPTPRHLFSEKEEGAIPPIEGKSAPGQS